MTGTGMDQLLSSTTFNEVYQINSPWFSSETPLPNSKKQNGKKAGKDAARSDHIAKRQRMSKDYEKPQPDQPTMDLSVDRDLDNPSYCAKSFLLLSTLASQEQDLLMPMAGIELPDRVKRSDSSSDREQRLPPGNVDDEETMDEADSSTSRPSHPASYSDLDGRSGCTSTLDTPLTSVLSGYEEANVPVASPFDFGDLVNGLDEEVNNKPTLPHALLHNNLDQKKGVSNAYESSKITGDLERDLGLDGDDIGYI